MSTDKCREALAELVRVYNAGEKFYYSYTKSDAEIQDAWAAARAALAQPVEPVALTDEKIVEIAESCGYDGAVPTVRLAFQGFKLWDFARAIERAVRGQP